MPTFAWRADGLIKSRTLDAGSAVTFGYDSAKRLTEIAKGSHWLRQAYDRDGNVTSESRSLGLAGDAGTGTQTFTYDALNRVTGASGLGTSFTYTYDRNGNRKTKADGTTTLSSTYDRTDQLRTVGNGVLADAAFTYNSYGDLTTKVEKASGGAWQTTAYAYDLAGKLTAIDGPAAGTADDVDFTFDALGRFRTRVLAGSSDTYGYLGTTETVVRVNTSGGTDVLSLVDSAGNRLAAEAGSTLNWFLPDPHGNVVAALSADEATVTNALRYDPWGELAASGSGGGTAVGASYWKYQGRLDVAPAGSDAGALYDLSARFYSPSLGAFTQLDSVMGSAQDPRSMNRFLYAHANPATLIDPTGHVAMQACSSMADYCPGASGSLYKPKANKKARADKAYVYRPSGAPAKKQARVRPGAESRRVPGVGLVPSAAAADVLFPYGTFRESVAAAELKRGYPDCADPVWCAHLQQLSDEVRSAYVEDLKDDRVRLAAYIDASNADILVGVLSFLAGPECADMGGVCPWDLEGSGHMTSPRNNKAEGVRALARLLKGLFAAKRAPLEALSAKNSTVLARNLLSAMGPGALRPAKHDAHHLVSGLDPRAADSRELLRRFGIDLNDAANGVFLPAGAHRALHTGEYHASVLGLLREASNPWEAMDALDYVRRQVAGAAAAGGRWP